MQPGGQRGRALAERAPKVDASTKTLDIGDNLLVFLREQPGYGLLLVTIVIIGPVTPWIVKHISHLIISLYNTYTMYRINRRKLLMKLDQPDSDPEDEPQQED